MPYQSPKTIKETLDEITKRTLVLPAIQREFVWQPDQICRLFDSLMQGYPFGTFLYWKVNPENSGKFQFYDFVLNYHQRDRPHNEPLQSMPDRQLMAVLDGQQRLTALNIGLSGSMALKLPRLWRNNPGAFPVSKLYLDLLWQPDDDDDDEGLAYKFDFLTDKELASAKNRMCWFPVQGILSIGELPDLADWLHEQQLENKRFRQANRTLYQLYEIVHSKLLVSYYEESSQDLDKALQIFIRTNSGGTVLSYSDLLLSIAVAQWTHHDAREEIHSFVDEINRIGTGFLFSKDLVLKAGLMLSDIGSVGFRVGNFNRENMAILEDKWNDIKQALSLTVQLISNYGFNGQNLSATNAILPIAYYLYLRKPGEAYLTHNQYKEDRESVREWLVRSLLKSGVWGSGLDTLLTALRQIISEGTGNKFPVVRISEEMARRGRSLVFEDEEIEDLADMQYGDRLTFPLLSLLFSFDYLRNQFHVDHIFPTARFTRRQLRAGGVPKDKVEDYIRRRNGLANLQLLPGAQNLEKSAKMPFEWIMETFPKSRRRKEYRRDHLLGKVPKKITEFDDFYDARRELLKEEITRLLGRQPVPGTTV